MLPEKTLGGSFTEFVEVIEPKLRVALCAAFGRDRGLEAVAAALAYGWEHWDRISSMENPAGYLWTVGRHHGGRAGRRAVVFSDVEVGDMPHVEPGLPRALDRLSARQRTAVVLVHGFDWAQTEVAEMLGVSPATVQRHLERGLARLRRMIGVPDAS